jgi:16S rRNA processing protein RimM
MSRSRKEIIQSNTINEGSPTPGEPLYIPVGKFGRPFSYRGAITFYPQAEYQNIFNLDTELLIGETKQPTQVTSIRIHGKGLLFTLQGYTSNLESGRLTNQIAYLPIKKLPPLEEGDYYRYQLVGLEVLTIKGESLGVLEEILPTGANDVYVVKDALGKETLLPAIQNVIIKVDLQNRSIIVNPPEWE